MIVSSANRKDKNEIVPCMVDKPINHLLKLLESCTAPLIIITKDYWFSITYVLINGLGIDDDSERRVKHPLLAQLARAPDL